MAKQFAARQPHLAYSADRGSEARQDAHVDGAPGAATLGDSSFDEQAGIWAALSHECAEGIVVCNTRQRIVFVNPAFERVTGYASHEAVGQSMRLLKSGQHDTAFYAEMWRSINLEGRWRGELCNRRKNGELYTEWLTIAGVRNTSGTLTHYIGVFSDLTQRKRADERVRALLSFDVLTQLPNRKLLLESLQGMIAGAPRGKIGLLFIDLDRFKHVNDSLGHDAGDLLLQTTALRLGAIVRSSDFVARLGGDEFAIVVPNLRDAADADQVGRKVSAEIMKPVLLGEIETQVSGSIGVSLFPDDAASAADLLRHAEMAMYSAKSMGRGNCHLYSNEMRQAPGGLELETALRGALRRKEFELYYQPQLNLKTGEVDGVEALIRWHRPNVGLVAPGDFIPFAEECGLITEIGQWTLEAAVEQAVCLARADLGITIAINLSASQFHGGSLADRVESILTEANLSPSSLEIEITEGVALQNVEATIDILCRLQQYGVQLSIDDFGIGYSSLTYLRRFPVNKIKIDRSFVSEMTLDESAAGIVRGVIALAHGLRLEVVAEGVETAEQLHYLREWHCERAQGYYISRPLPAAQLQAFLRQWPAKRDSVLPPMRLENP